MDTLDEAPQKRQVNPLLGFSLAVVGFITVLLAFKIGGPVKHSYAFVTADHPIDMWAEGTDKWSYFMNERQESTQSTADRARKELLPQGFTEDTSQAPWYRFVKGKEEVVVCYHDEFSVNQLRSGGSKLVKGIALTKGAPKPPPGVIIAPDRWSCVLVKNGPGTETSVGFFALKKLVHGW